MFIAQPETVLRIIKPTPLVPTSQYSGNMFGFGGYSQQPPEEGGVLDLRTYRQHPADDPVTGQLTPPREEACTSPALSPTLALTQRVLAAASHPQSGTRPFKAYPKDPLALSGAGQDESYLRFREEMLAQVRGGAKSQRRPQPGSPSHSHSGGEGDGEKDAAYWERRRKNNEAAKRSRDARRAKEDEIAIRAAFLEQENLKLRYQIAAITEEYNHMRRAFYQTSHHHALQPIV